MNLRPLITALPVAILAVSSITLTGQSLDLSYDREENMILLEVEATPTRQFWLAESSNLVDWTNRVFVDSATVVEIGPPVTDAAFYRLETLYRTLAWSNAVAMPVARDQFTGGVIDGKLYLFGGNGDPGGINLNRLDIYDLATGEWSRGADYDFGIEELSSAVMDGKLFVFGGYNNGPTGICLRYDPGTDTWSEIATKPTPVQATMAVPWKNEILTVGSFVSDDDGLTTVVDAYNTTTNTWRTVTNLPDESELPAAAIYEDILYVIGGVNLDILTAYNKIRRFDLNTGVWLSEITGNLPYPVLAPYSTACPVVNGKIIIAGGLVTVDDGFTFSNPATDATTTNRVTVYDIASNTFSQNTPLPEAVHGELFLLHGDTVFAVGGRLDLDEDIAIRSDRMYIGTFGE